MLSISSPNFLLFFHIFYFVIYADPQVKFNLSLTFFLGRNWGWIEGSMCVRREGISHSVSNNRSSSCLILVQDFFPNTVIANNKNMLKNTTYNLCGFIKALHWLLKRCPTTPLIFSFPNSSKQQQCNDQDPLMSPMISPYSSPLIFLSKSFWF